VRRAARYSCAAYRQTAAGFACGKGVISGTLTGCADVPLVRMPARLNSLISHVPKGGFFFDHKGRFAPRA
jgi:hypothetical protein